MLSQLNLIKLAIGLLIIKSFKTIQWMTNLSSAKKNCILFLLEDLTCQVFLQGFLFIA